MSEQPVRVRKSVSKNYELIKSNAPSGTFSGSTPQRAAQKAAVRGHTDILLRETGTQKYFAYKGAVQPIPSDKLTPMAVKIGARYRGVAVPQGRMRGGM